MSKTVKEYHRIAIISAMPIELEYADVFLTNRDGWIRHEEGRYEYAKHQLQVFTRVVGAGKVNAAYQTADVIHDVQPDLIVNVGYAGGLAEGAKKGDVAIGKDYVQADFLPLLGERPLTAETPDWLIKELEKTAKHLRIPTFTGRIATGDFFLHHASDRIRIIKEFHPIAFDMESAAIAQVAANKEPDLAVLRTFSDLADEDALESIKDTSIQQEASKIPIEQRPIVLILTTLENLVSK